MYINYEDTLTSKMIVNKLIDGCLARVFMLSKLFYGDKWGRLCQWIGIWSFNMDVGILGLFYESSRFKLRNHV